mmetsp:Transcript_19499/g.47815  ORF Transcript_19499/g.47815 Transcript_19499/m.47815 type:complete len:160 (+) Transcript_19499:3002-3481(+)
MAANGDLSESFALLVVCQTLVQGLEPVNYMRDKAANLCKKDVHALCKHIVDTAKDNTLQEIHCTGGMQVYTEAKVTEIQLAASNFTCWVSSQTTSAMHFNVKNHCLYWCKLVHSLLQLKGSVSDAMVFEGHPPSSCFWFGPVSMDLAQRVMLLVQDLVC